MTMRGEQHHVTLGGKSNTDVVRWSYPVYPRHSETSGGCDATHFFPLITVVLGLATGLIALDTRIIF